MPADPPSSPQPGPGSSGYSPGEAATEATRQSLLERVRGMDPDGWEELYRRYRQMIAGRARQAGLNEADIDDVIQMVFAAVARNPPGPSPRPGAFRNWLREQAKWRIHDKLRETGRQPPQVSWENAEGEQGSPLDTLAADDEFGRQWDNEYARHVADVAKHRLAAESSPEHLQMFLLMEEQGWSPAQVARQFRIAIPTAYVVRHRLSGRLKTHVASILQRLDEGGQVLIGTQPQPQAQPSRKPLAPR